MINLFGCGASKRVLHVAGLFFSFSVLAVGAQHASAETTLERVQREGAVRVGFNNEAPYSYITTDGLLTGEAPEVAKAVLAKMGIDNVEGVLTEFSSLIPGLQAGRFDIIAAGMFITPKRCQQILFSEPSYGIGQALLVKEGNPKGLSDYNSIAADDSLTLAVMAGGVEVGYATAAGVSRSQLLLLPDQASLVKAVQSGRADAAGSTAFGIAGMVEKTEGVESSKPFGEVAGQSVKGHGGFGFRQDDKDLQAEFNRHLQDYIGSPDHISRVTSFGFGESYLPNKNTSELCADS